MKKNAIVLLVLSMIGSMVMRGQHAVDTLYVNEFKNVALFFPSPIERAVTGHEGFVFSYNREGTDHVGLLQGVEGMESNLLVITVDKRVYAFVLKYATILSQLNRFVREGEEIGKLWPIKEVQVKHDSYDPEGSRYDRACKLLLDREPKVEVSQRKKGIRLRLEDMVYDGREVYLVLAIRNRSKIDFEVDRLEVQLVSGSNRRRATFQEIPMVPIHEYNRPNLVEHGKTKRFVFALPKFVLGDNDHLRLVLGELHGNRRVELVK
ncbi:DUF4138 domain-containing protein [Flagellimonas lutimaris]|uniref:DUF4138 domain-containing protein n=1 Tax=Flagellimonas lutimaris TaxID=475082 RepID=UPI0039C18C53